MNCKGSEVVQKKKMTLDSQTPTGGRQAEKTTPANMGSLLPKRKDESDEGIKSPEGRPKAMKSLVIGSEL